MTYLEAVYYNHVLERYGKAVVINKNIIFSILLVIAGILPLFPAIAILPFRKRLKSIKIRYGDRT